MERLQWAGIFGSILLGLATGHRTHRVEIFGLCRLGTFCLGPGQASVRLYIYIVGRQIQPTHNDVNSGYVTLGKGRSACPPPTSLQAPPLIGKHCQVLDTSTRCSSGKEISKCETLTSYCLGKGQRTSPPSVCWPDILPKKKLF